MLLQCRYALHYPRLGLPDLMQLIVSLNAQPDFRIDPQDLLKLNRRRRLYWSFPRYDLADEFHRALASSKNVSLPLN